MNEDRARRVLVATLLALLLPNVARGVDYEELVASIADLESRLVNLTVHARGRYESLEDGRWEPSGEFDLTAYFDGRPGGRGRVDYHKLVTRWEAGSAPFSESRSARAFDGSTYRAMTYEQFGLDAPAGTRLREYSGNHGSFSYERNTAALEGGPSGWSYSIFGCLQQLGIPFSKYLTRHRESITVSEVAAGLEIASNLNGYERTFVVDPQRGFALLQCRSRFQTTEYELRVLEVEGVGSGIWFPTRARSESQDALRRRSRTTWSADLVSVNDPEFDERVFTLEWPPGARVRDRVREINLYVPLDGGEPQEVPEELVDQDATAPTPAVGVEPAPADGPERDESPERGGSREAESTRTRNPWYLILAVVCLAIAAWAWRRRKSSASVVSER